MRFTNCRLPTRNPKKLLIRIISQKALWFNETCETEKEQTIKLVCSIKVKVYSAHLGLSIMTGLPSFSTTSLR